MKKLFIHLLTLTLFTVRGFCANSNIEKLKQNPGLYLSLQDVPIFSEDSPLTGMQAFTLIPPLSFKDPEMQKKVASAIEKKLQTIGNVIHLKDNDMRGFGAGNILMIQIGKATEWDGKEMALFRISLQVETSVVLNKTGVSTFPAVWSINTFSQSDDRIKAIQKLVDDFVENYQYANQGQKDPVFYVYD